MKIPIFGSELSPQNMVRVKGGGVLKCVGGLMGMAYGEELMKGGRAFLSIYLLLVGEGTRIRFWHDRWIGDNTLKDFYPDLYVCSEIKDACISEVL